MLRQISSHIEALYPYTDPRDVSLPMWIDNSFPAAVRLRSVGQKLLGNASFLLYGATLYLLVNLSKVQANCQKYQKNGIFTLRSNFFFFMYLTPHKHEKKALRCTHSNAPFGVCFIGVGRYLSLQRYNTSCCRQLLVN